MATLQERAQLLLDASKDAAKQAAHYELCRRDVKYWINNFCYTYDPRGKGTLPFNLYPFQEWFVDILKEKIDAQVDIDIEKTRDMGASWLICLLFQHYWIFQPGSSFLVGSITEEDVDKNLVDPEDTLFGKLRFNLEYQPAWIVGKGDYTDKHLSLLNERNGNSITGKAPTSNFGRGARKTAILFDEIAFWQWARAAYDSASQTTQCRINNSTPNGKYNLYGERMTDPTAKRIIWPGRSELVKQKKLYAA